MNSVEYVKLPQCWQLTCLMRHHMEIEWMVCFIKRWLRQNWSQPCRSPSAQLLVRECSSASHAKMANTFSLCTVCLARVLSHVPKAPLETTWLHQPWPVTSHPNTVDMILGTIMGNSNVCEMSKLINKGLHEDFKNKAVLVGVVLFWQSWKQIPVGIAVANKVAQHLDVLSFPRIWPMQLRLNATTQQTVEGKHQKRRVLFWPSLVTVDDYWDCLPQVDLARARSSEDRVVGILHLKVSPPCFPNVALPFVVRIQQAAENVKAVVLEKKHQPIPGTQKRNLQTLVFGIQKRLRDWQCQFHLLCQQPSAVSFPLVGTSLWKLKKSFWHGTHRCFPKISHDVPGRSDHSSAWRLSKPRG